MNVSDANMALTSCVLLSGGDGRLDHTVNLYSVVGDML
jgi:hypothetical protein